MAVDYLKTYLGIDPDDYSAMEARIRGEEPQARVPFMRQPMMMPQRRSLSDIEAMQACQEYKYNHKLMIDINL